MDGITERAKRLMDQVMKTWSPPRFSGDEAEQPAVVAQTTVMIAIAYIMGREFMPNELTENQRAAIDSGLKLIKQTIGD